MLLTELKKQVNKMGNILGRVAMKRDEYWQLILGKLRKLEKDEIQIETATISNTTFTLKEGITTVIIGFNGTATAELLIPNNPTDIKKNIHIYLSDSGGSLDIKTISTLPICKYLDTQGTKYTLSGGVSLHLFSCDTYYFGVFNF
jgi:hypothetical protein